jgi:hypothetical protein
MQITNTYFRQQPANQRRDSDCLQYLKSDIVICKMYSIRSILCKLIGWLLPEIGVCYLHPRPDNPNGKGGSVAKQGRSNYRAF